MNFHPNCLPNLRLSDTPKTGLARNEVLKPSSTQSSSRYRLKSSRTMRTMQSTANLDKVLKLHEKAKDEEIIKKNKEIQRLQYFSQHLVNIQKKKEEMIALLLDENRNLHKRAKFLEQSVEKKLDDLKKKNAKIESLEEKLNRLKKQSLVKLAPNIINDSAIFSKGSNESFRKNSIDKMDGRYERRTSTRAFLHPAAEDRYFRRNEDIYSRKYLDQKRKKLLAVLHPREDADGLSLFSNIKGRSEILKYDADMLNNKFERSIQFMELIELVHNSELFRERITILSDFELEEILWIFRAIFVDLKNQLGVIEKIKKLIRCSQSMDISLPITEAIEKIVELICEIVSCDRATVFMLDEETGFLWSKVAKGSQGTIRIPKNKGIVGSVVTTGEKIVIEDAYSDPRFNQEVDKKTNYRTKTILCVPIRDSSGNIIGACQAINKINGYFSPDDEYLFELLSKQAGTFLKYAIEYDQNLIFQHRLKTMIQIGNTIFRQETKEAIIKKGEKTLKEIFNVDKSIIFLVNEEKKLILHYNELGEQHTYPFTGLVVLTIVGEAIQTRELIHVGDAYTHSLFNGKVDIETSMPLIVLPIQSTDKGSIIAALEVINKKGVAGRTLCNKPHIDLIQGEMLNTFIDQITIALNRMIKFEEELNNINGFNDYLNKGEMTFKEDAMFSPSPIIEREPPNHNLSVDKFNPKSKDAETMEESLN